MNADLKTKTLHSANRAMQGAVTHNLRAVTIDLPFPAEMNILKD